MVKKTTKKTAKKAVKTNKMVYSFGGGRADGNGKMKELLGGKVFLSLFVKVKEGWRDSERTIRNWGYKDE